MAFPQDNAPLRYQFAGRGAAEQACARIEATIPGSTARLGVTGEAYVVTVTGIPTERREAAWMVVEDAGGQLAPDVGDHAPRRVQPGFTDAAPGIVPEATEFSREHPEDYEGPGGRFAQQLDRAPETPEGRKKS